jgi:Ca2+-binding EF-hand superfamily protein
MISRRNVLSAIGGTMLTGGLVSEAMSASAAIRAFDTDADGTVDLQEVKKAAAALFDRLDRDKDGTLERRELGGRLSARDFAAANPDKDGTLTKDEYLALVERRFRAADPDGDGTLDAKELGSKAGRALLRLMK